MDELRLIRRAEGLAIMLQSIRAVASIERPLQILEAGCGQKWDLDINGLRYFLTGVDLDANALKMRIETLNDLDAGITGDLRAVSLPESSFDVIYCCYVLEHIAKAEVVLRNFFRWLRPGGIAIVKVPDPHSVHGFLTRITPHWFHVLFYRYVLGAKDAGTPGHGPYPTYYDPVISRPGMRQFCADHGLSLVEFGDASEYADKFLGLIVRVVGMLAFGRLSVQHSDLLYVIHKK